MSQKFFRTDLILYSSFLPVISDIPGKSAGDGVVFGSVFTREIARDQMPKECQEFFMSEQLQLPFEEKKDGRVS